MIKLLALFFIFNIGTSYAKTRKTRIHKKNKMFDKLTLRSGMKTDVVESQDLKSRIFGYVFRLDSTQKISPELELFFSANAILETGSNEIVGVVAEFQPFQTIILNSGGVKYSPFDFFHLRMGAIDQVKYNSPLFIGANAFAAIEENFNFGFLHISFQQAIPSNNKLTKRIGNVDAGTPQLLSETIGLKFGDIKKSFFNIDLTHFTYQDLSSEIARKSNSFGNSITGIGNATKFNYEFSGFNMFLNSSVELYGFKLNLDGEYLFNELAPSNRNTGTLVRLGVSLATWTLSLESFSNQSDTAPAFYNSKYYGHNNMQGNAAILQLTKKKFNLAVRYAQINPIEVNNLQSKTEILSFNLSKYYDF